ncbi:unnamed protein product [Chilo suppressalis]|uniref:CUE domain-containing protein n=1 Tax=Chilo suppressalis TaxID=168631 RepID=A0ABN8L659_CHISP|nr:unnamed protein product [Chilo suppressalis]
MEHEISFDFSSVVDSLVNLFGDVLSRDVIETIVDSCGGDLNLSADAIMNVTSETKPGLQKNDFANSKNSDTKDAIPLPLERTTTQDKASSSKQPSSVSYAESIQTTGAVPKQQIKFTQPNKNSLWNEQFCRIVSYHNRGYRVLILMRGLPGSGKSFIANRIIEATIGGSFADLKTHICSTDDYFMVGRRYNFNKQDLPYAHSLNHKRSIAAMEQGLSPVIIDNTNIEIWETEPYVKAAVANGYIIEVVEPNTPWAKKPNQLCRRNVHNVPVTSIKRMLNNYINNITGDSLIKSLGLSYPADKVPPVIRAMPFYQPTSQNPDLIQANNVNDSPSSSQQPEPLDTCDSNNSLSDFHTVEQTPIQAIDNNAPPSTIASNISTAASGQVLSSGQNCTDSVAINKDEYKNNDEDNCVINLYKDVQRQFEEIEKVEQEWESGENWVAEHDVSTNPNKITQNIETTTPKPQRKKQSESISEDKVLGNIAGCEDWRQISMFMPSWDETDKLSSWSTKPKNQSVETMTSSTCMEIGDAENNTNMLKVLAATPRDINQFIFSINKEKIPEKRMLDKSSMTNENFITDATKRCQSEEKHFKEFRRLFKHVSKNALRDIFDKCMGDVNWAVEIVLDGVESKELPIDNECASDGEEEANTSDEHCSCLAAYNILPDKSSSQIKLENVESQEESTPKLSGSPTRPQGQKKQKRDNIISGDSLILKRLIEKNVGFSENHYSEHCLKIRKIRRGENAGIAETMSENDESDNATALPDSTCHASVSPTNEQQSDDEVSNSSVDDVEKTVVFNLGKDFIAELDMLFGRTNMTYPDKVVPKINIPLSLLNEINALWMESLMHQLDEHDKQTTRMLSEDEELARLLAIKEAELALAGKEPEVPDFKEIMDMDFALSLYQKDVAEWRNKIPDDLAAKLTRDKLYNLFTDIPKDILSELLLAHDNNFQTTVEVLLMSTGKTEILEDKNGLNKFVLQKEMERQERILEEERRALSEVEWPPLPRGEVVEMSVVNGYREKAERHLLNRNMQKTHMKKFTKLIRKIKNKTVYIIKLLKK